MVGNVLLFLLFAVLCSCGPTNFTLVDSSDLSDYDVNGVYSFILDVNFLTNGILFVATNDSSVALFEVSSTNELTFIQDLALGGSFANGFYYSEQSLLFVSHGIGIIDIYEREVSGLFTFHSNLDYQELNQTSLVFPQCGASINVDTYADGTLEVLLGCFSYTPSAYDVFSGCVAVFNGTLTSGFDLRSIIQPVNPYEEDLIIFAGFGLALRKHGGVIQVSAPRLSKNSTNPNEIAVGSSQFFRVNADGDYDFIEVLSDAFNTFATYSYFGIGGDFDDQTIAVGQPLLYDTTSGEYEGSVYVYSTGPDLTLPFNFEQTLNSGQENDGFGITVRLLENILVISAPALDVDGGTIFNSGALFIYERSTDNADFELVQTLTTDDNYNYFGGEFAFTRSCDNYILASFGDASNEVSIFARDAPSCNSGGRSSSSSPMLSSSLF